MAPPVDGARRLRELVPTLVVVALLVATAAAFVWTERQKLQPPPLVVRDVSEVISPVCRCDTAAAEIDLEFRRRTRLTLEIATEEGDVVRTLVAGEPQRGPVLVRWNGRSDDGAPVPDGTYRPRVRLGDNPRVFLLPNRIEVDTAPPHITLVRVEPKEVSGRKPRSRVRVFWVINERAQALLYVGDRLHARSPAKRGGKFDWFPRRRGVPIRPGRYPLRLRARDVAGNLGAPTRVVVVRVRR